MAYTIDWIVREQLIWLRLDGAVQPSDVHAISQEVVAMISAVDAPLVHLFIDITQLTDFSKNAADYMRLDFSRAANTGWIIFIGGNAMMRFLANIIVGRAGQLSKSVRLNFQEDYDAATAYLIARDAVLTTTLIRHNLDLLEQQSPTRPPAKSTDAGDE